MHFVLLFIYKNPHTLRYFLISKKQPTLRYVYIYIIYPIIMISNYKRTYNQSDYGDK